MNPLLTSATNSLSTAPRRSDRGTRSSHDCPLRLPALHVLARATRGAERFKLVLTHGGSIAIVSVPAGLVPLSPRIAL